MGDTKVTRHGLHFQTVLEASPACWTHAASVVIVQVTEEEFSQMDCLHLWAQGLQTDRLTDKRPSDEPQASTPFDMAPIAYLPDGPALGIRQWWKCFGIGSL